MHAVTDEHVDPVPHPRLVEVQFLLFMGESPWQVAAILGLSLSTLAKWLGRHGHHDLARPFYAAAAQQRQEAA